MKLRKEMCLLLIVSACGGIAHDDQEALGEATLDPGSVEECGRFATFDESCAELDGTRQRGYVCDVSVHLAHVCFAYAEADRYWQKPWCCPGLSQGPVHLPCSAPPNPCNESE